MLVDNDVNIMALGEKHAGLARSVDDFLFVKIGTGIGCGIVVAGEVYRGVRAVPATSATSGWTTTVPSAVRQHRLPGGVLRRRRARRDAVAAARAEPRGARPMLARAGTLTRRTSLPRLRGDPSRSA